MVLDLVVLKLFEIVSVVISEVVHVEDKFEPVAKKIDIKVTLFETKSFGPRKLKSSYIINGDNHIKFTY